MFSISSLSSTTLFSTYPTGTERTRAAQPTAEKELSSEEKKQVADLKQQDAEVRRHEQAHLAAAGSYGQGPPTYEYKEGPDGKQYAVGGHVGIDTEEVPGDPEATLKKARIIKRAAVAPKEPSQQDRKVAQEAEQMAQKAERELRDQKAEEAKTHPGGAADAQPGEAEAPGATPKTIAQGYDRHGSPVVRPAASARINVFV